jgi:hypothetical protein
LLKRAKLLYDFVEEVIRELKEDEILGNNSTYFGFKANADIKKKKLNHDGQVKTDSMRFTPEISYLAEIISKKLK